MPAIVRLAARDEVAVANDLGIRVLGACIDDVVLDREEAGRALPLQAGVEQSTHGRGRWRR